jgi:hypothetical protein
MKQSRRKTPAESLGECEAKLSIARTSVSMLTQLSRKMDMVVKVAEMHDLFGHPVDTRDIYGTAKEDLDFNELSVKLIREETKELLESLGDPESGSGEIHEKAAILKEMCDVLVVVIGRAVGWGWDLSTAFERVMESQKSKLGPDGRPVYRKDGKFIKGPNYEAPDLSDLCDS